MTPVGDRSRCPVCGWVAPADGGTALRQVAGHLIARAGASDATHVMWLNRTLTKDRRDEEALAALLESWHAGSTSGARRVAR